MRRTGGWSSVILGVILLIAGLAWGVIGSHSVSYVNSQQNVTYRIGTGTTSGNVYIHADGSSEYFVALNGDFDPPISQSDIANSTSLSFIARSDTTSINLTADDGSTITEAHEIEKLVFYDKNGNVMSTYTTAEYDANPNGVYTNTWSDSIWLVVVGVVLVLVGMLNIALRGRRRGNAGFSIAGSAPPYQPMPPSNPMAQQNMPPSYPSGQPNMANPQNPYGQPYQGANPYAQQNPYNQPPNNPYQQPPQGY